MRDTTDRRRWAGAIAIAGTMLALFQLVSWYPGTLSYDAGYAYDQLHKGMVNDWNPPAMTRLWQGLEAIGLRGTAPLFALQVVGLWLGTTLIAAALAMRGRRLVALAVLACAMLPLVFGWQTSVIKDSQLTAALVPASGLIGWFVLRDRRPPWFVLVPVALLMCYAVLVRSNGVFSALPLALAIAARPGARLLGRATVVTAALIMALAALAPIINHRMFDASPAHAERSVLLFDMAGTTHFAHLPAMPGLTPAEWAESERRHCYWPYFWDWYSLPEHCGFVSDKLFDTPLLHDWASVVSAHPLAYAEHRVRHWNTMLRFLVPHGMINFEPPTKSIENPYGVGSPGGPWYDRLYRAQVVANHTPASWPITYFVLSIAVAMLAVRAPVSGQRTMALALAGSAALQMSSFAVVSVASDTRYHQWSIYAAVVGAIILLDAPGVSRRGWIIASVILVLVAGLSVWARFTFTELPWPPETY